MPATSWGGGSEILEVNRAGEVVWRYAGDLAFAHSAERQADGSTLITDTNHQRLLLVDKDGAVRFDSSAWGDALRRLAVRLSERRPPPRRRHHHGHRSQPRPRGDRGPIGRGALELQRRCDSRPAQRRSAAGRQHPGGGIGRRPRPGTESRRRGGVELRRRIGRTCSTFRATSIGSRTDGCWSPTRATTGWWS